MKRLKTLSRREREIMDILYAFDGASATAGEIRSRIPSPPSYSAVRATLRILEQKGVLRHEANGASYVYKPVLTRHKARQGAIEHLLTTFFNGSAAGAVLTLLESPGTELSTEELDRMAKLIEQARNEERK
ncbi:MAG TPA: BlaI/MecI/CopY family transcriptional regulator [Candidatus Eisenbacteria bacterium]|jgi:predicted transcriptional regulator|nr:BlaI/MecI/CopY family transcriptional regulator [Candidatus Eisenbacteria bacterium]